MNADELIGRDDVVAAVSGALSAEGEHGAALLVAGEPGIGKTAVLRATAQLAASRGRVVLETAGSEAETHLRFAGLHRLLRPVLHSVERLPQVQQRALLGALGMQAPVGDAPGLSLHVATLHLLGLAGEGAGLAITVDDVQSLDEDTRQVLSFVARRLHPRDMLVAAASSTWPDLPSFASAFREVRLRRLSDSEAHRLVAGSGKALHRAQRRWVVAQAAGNPLALQELARTAEVTDVVNQDPVNPTWSLTPALERAFASPVDALPDTSRDVLLVAAVAADAGVQEILAATSRLAGRTVGTELLEPPLELGLVSLRGTRLHFSHPLVRAAIVDKEPVSRRQAAHRALGSVIAVNADRRAWHRALGTAVHDDSVAAELEATATRPRHRDSPTSVVALERAAQLSTTPLERGRRLLLAASLAARLGQAETVARLVTAALTGELSASDRVRVELLREDVDGVVTDNSRVLRLCNAATDAIAGGDPALALDLADAAARRRCAAPVSGAALSALTSLAELVLERCDDSRALTVYALADPVGHGRAVLSALARVEEAPFADSDRLSAYAVAARSVGDYAAASELFDQAEIALRARGLLSPLARNLSVVADVRVELGEWDRASAALKGFAALSAASRSPSHRTSALATAAKLAALRGESAQALDLVSEIEGQADTRSGSRMFARVQIIRGINAIAGGNHVDAYGLLACVFDPTHASHHFREQFDAVAYFAEAAALVGRRDEARVLVERMSRVAEISGSPSLLGQLAYAEAVLAFDEAAEERLLVALASPANVSAWHRARVQLAHGRWLRRQHRVTQSRGPLQESLTVFRRLGALRWATEASDELEAAGVTPEAEHGSALAGLLSNQELKIAQFAAQGLSNREIGNQMYLSARTVSSHLYRIFPKLGISARGQIASRLDEASAHVTPGRRPPV